MKKTKITAVCLLLACFAAFAGYKAYDISTPSDLLLFQNVEVLAKGENSDLWFRTDEDCTWSGTGKRNSSLTVTIRGTEVSV